MFFCYSTVKLPSIEKSTDQSFLENNLELAFAYGSDVQLMNKNKIVIQSPYGLKLRTDKILSEITGLSRSRIMEMTADKRTVYAGKNLAAITRIWLEETDELYLS